MTTLLEKALAAKRESKHVEFKAAFDPESRQDWCEIVKDLVGIANSGGGVVAFGLNSKGTPVGTDLSPLQAVDPATFTDHIHRYTETHFSELQFHEAEKGSHVVVVLEVGSSPLPIVFARPGTYPVKGGKQKTAFSQGTVYFRHGAKSEPGTTEDLARALDRRLEEIRQGWMKGLRKVTQAPPGSQVTVLPPEIRDSDSPQATPIRIVDDPSAPTVRVLDPDVTHPYRQKELISEVRKQLPKSARFNSFDVLAVRKAHGIDRRAEFAHSMKFGSTQYSKSFVDWITNQYKRDGEFFTKSRATYRAR